MGRGMGKREDCGSGRRKWGGEKQQRERGKMWKKRNFFGRVKGGICNQREAEMINEILVEQRREVEEMLWGSDMEGMWKIKETCGGV